MYSPSAAASIYDGGDSPKGSPASPSYQPHYADPRTTSYSPQPAATANARTVVAAYEMQDFTAMMAQQADTQGDPDAYMSQREAGHANKRKALK